MNSARDRRGAGARSALPVMMTQRVPVRRCSADTGRDGAGPPGFARLTPPPPARTVEVLVRRHRAPRTVRRARRCRLPIREAGRPRCSSTAAGPRWTLQSRRLEPPSEQAHVPAEQPPAREDARLPAADADSRRSRDPRRAPDQGPRPLVGLIEAPVLPARARLRRRQEFSEVVARSSGAVRVARGSLVAHVDVPDHEGAPADLPDADQCDPAALRSAAASPPVRIGFVVSRAVGGAVVRNSVRRRLRHLAAERLDRLPPGARVVVRALPAAAGASALRLGSDLDAALTEAQRRLAVRHSRAGRPS